MLFLRKRSLFRLSDLEITQIDQSDWPSKPGGSPALSPSTGITGTGTLSLGPDLYEAAGDQTQVLRFTCQALLTEINPHPPVLHL